MRLLLKTLLTVSGLLVLFAFPAVMLAQSETQAVLDLPTAEANHAVTAEAELPNSPGATRSQSQAASPSQAGSSQSSSQSTSAPSSQTPSQAQTSQSTQSQSEQQTLPTASKPQQPVGTAVAETPVVSGSAAAEPAGVAIAPAKQHRVRTIVIKVGAIVGAGVALGTTLALTEGTSSRPPGAR